MRPTTLTLALLASITQFGAAAADAPAKFPATLAGHAIVPATTAVAPPADAPADLKTSGKYTAPDGRRVDQLNSLPGTSFLAHKDAPRTTGYALPIQGQPVQGFSGIKALGDGTFLVIADNGYGSKANSPDAMLMVHHLKPDWTSGRVEILGTTFLRDPDRKVPFRIATEASDTRYLTGADFDIESVQVVGNELWFGDELGPFLLRADRSGKVLAVYETKVDGKVVRSPDHPAVTTPAVPTGTVAFTIRRSRGFEGLAASKDGKFLYALLEGPVWNAETKDWEKVEGREALRILEFDVAKGAWTGRHWTYLLEVPGNNIGDVNMIDATTALVIERDNGEGDVARACAADKPAPNCFNTPAKFKRIYKIDLTDASAGGLARKIGYVDLLDIADPNGVAKQGGRDKTMTMPFVTIENVDIVNATQIVVANDNNFPYSAGREPTKQDDNELLLLDVPAFLTAR